MFDRILVAVDGSDCAFQGLRTGLELAAGAGASVDVVHATRPGGDHASTVLDEAAEMAASADATVEFHSVEGDPASVIVSQARERGADLVVVGRHGRGGFARRLLGSVTRRVLRRSDRPVLTVPADGPFSVAEVLVTTDGSEAAEWAVPYAAAVAGRHGATVHALTAIDLETEAGPFSAGGLTDAEVERYEERGRDRVDRLADRLGGTDPSLSVRTAVRRDRPHEAIRSYVDEHGIDLVVMSSRGQSSFAGQLLGSVTERVLRVVGVPVLVVVGDER
jgi:nucleotide-binding universal stress UspA family protein